MNIIQKGYTSFEKAKEITIFIICVLSFMVFINIMNNISKPDYVKKHIYFTNEKASYELGNNNKAINDCDLSNKSSIPMYRILLSMEVGANILKKQYQEGWRAITVNEKSGSPTTYTLSSIPHTWDEIGSNSIVRNDDGSTTAYFNLTELQTH